MWDGFRRPALGQHKPALPALRRGASRYQHDRRDEHCFVLGAEGMGCKSTPTMRRASVLVRLGPAALEQFMPEQVIELRDVRRVDPWQVMAGGCGLGSQRARCLMVHQDGHTRLIVPTARRRSMTVAEREYCGPPPTGQEISLALTAVRACTTTAITRAWFNDGDSSHKAQGCWFHLEGRAWWRAAIGVWAKPAGWIHAKGRASGDYSTYVAQLELGRVIASAGGRMHKGTSRSSSSPGGQRGMHSRLPLTLLHSGLRRSGVRTVVHEFFDLHARPRAFSCRCHVQQTSATRRHLLNTSSDVVSATDERQAERDYRYWFAGVHTSAPRNRDPVTIRTWHDFMPCCSASAPHFQPGFFGSHH
nr:hypothetical protein CFP56_00593 [Quercus suber]